MRVLITGIAGFAGSHLAELLLHEPEVELWGVVRGKEQASQAEDRIAHLQSQVHLLYGDLTNLDICRVILGQTQPDFIVHLAGRAVVADSWDRPWPAMEANIHTQLNILSSMVDLGLEARILVVGSNEEYGHVLPEELPINEETPLRPTSPYGVSKIAQDFLGLQYYLSHQVQAIRVRPFNHIGPRQRDAFVVPSFARQIAEIEAGLRAPVIRVGNLKAQRDFTDVRDMVRAYWLILQKGEPGEVYNIGSGQAHSIQHVLNLLLEMAQVSIRVEQDPRRLRPTDVPVSVCDASKLRAVTGWEPRIPLEQTLRDVLDEWRDRVQSSL